MQWTALPYTAPSTSTLRTAEVPVSAISPDGLATSPAELMNRQYRFQRHIYDATRTHYLLWRRRLIANLNPPDGGTIIEVACGTGWNLRRAAQRYPHARLFGFDISREMLNTAATSVRRAGLSARVRLAEADATAFDVGALYQIPHADRIFISYALSMIPDWPAVIGCATRQLAPDGSLHIVDFGRMDAMPDWPRAGFLSFLKHYNVSPRRDLETVARNVAMENGVDFSFEEMRNGYAAYIVLKRRPSL